MVGKQMVGEKERVRNHRGYYCAGDDSAYDVGVLRLRDDLMIEAKQCRDPVSYTHLDVYKRQPIN